MIESTDFDADGSSISDDISFSWKQPTKIDIDSVRNYFGEKIALYFQFLSFYANQLTIMAIVGLIT